MGQVNVRVQKLGIRDLLTNLLPCTLPLNILAFYKHLYGSGVNFLNRIKQLFKYGTQREYTGNSGQGGKWDD